MDPITTAVLAALSQLAKPAVKDAYDAFKALLARKFGKGSEVVKSVETLEVHPKSPGRQATFAEELSSCAADRDVDLLRLARALLEAAQPSSGPTLSVRQHVVGDHNLLAGTGNISINQDPRQKPSK